MTITRTRRQRGIIILLFTLMAIFVIFPAVGLAIDAGILFAIKAKLQTATDGAALAAARSLSRGLTLGAQQGSAIETAERFFNANVHDNWLGLHNPDLDVDFPAAPPKTTIVRVRSSVEASTYFMQILGFRDVTVRAAGAANRRDVNIVVVLDRSGSLDTDCPLLRSAAVSFVESFVDGRDNLGLVTFGTTYRKDFTLASNFRSKGGGQDMVTFINSINCVGGTNAGVAYWSAYQMLLALNEPGALNALLFFTDGLPTALHMPAMQIKGGPGNAGTSTCTNKNPKSAAITSGGTSPWGLNVALETNPPGSVPNPDWRAVAGSTSCYYAGLTAPNYRFSSVATDVVSLAANTATALRDVNNISLSGVKALANSGGQITLTGANVNNAAWNVMDNAAKLVRSQSVANGLAVITYTIGLGAVDQTLLNRVANTPDSGSFDPSQPVGLYVFAANGAQLQQAFAQLASDILRLSM